MYFGGGEEEYGRKTFEEIFFFLRRRRRIEKAKEQNNSWGTEAEQKQNKTKAEQKKQNTVIYFAHLDKKLELHTTLQDSDWKISKNCGKNILFSKNIRFS